jgi:hypothetical protein
LDIWPHEGDGDGGKDETLEHDQVPRIHDLLRLELDKSVELQFIDVARGAKSRDGSAVKKVGVSFEGAAGERMTTSMLALMVSASAADLVSTEYALASGHAAEGNPLMQSRPLRITTNLAIPFVAYLLARNNPRLGKWVCIVHVGLRGTISARNIYTGMTVKWK